MKNHSRTIALAVIAVLVISALMITDDGGMRTIVECGIMGDGRGWVPEDRKPFEGNFVGFKYKGHTDNLIDSHVYALETFEMQVLHAMRDALQAVRPGGVFVDVGANVGTHSMFMSRHASKTYAVEPWPDAVLRLEEHLKINAISNVEIRPVGYSNQVTTLPYHIPPGFNKGWGSFSQTYASDKYSGKEQGVIDLPLVPGDLDLLERGVENVGLIKIDIEGFEKPAFEGLAQILKRDRPAALFELNSLPDEGFKSEEDLRKTFPENYDFFEVKTRKEMLWKLPGGLLMCASADGEYWLEPYDMQFLDDGRNILAMPREKLKPLRMRFGSGLQGR